MACRRSGVQLPSAPLSLVSFFCVCVLTAFLAVLGPRPIRAAEIYVPNPGDYEAGLDFGGEERRYLMHVPRAVRSGAEPLVIVLHAEGGDAKGAIAITRMNEAADNRGFVVVYPNGSGRLKNNLLTWNAGGCCGYAAREKIDDVGFIRALLAWLKTTRAIDPGAVFIAGMANGGGMAYRLACALSDEVAAVAVVGAPPVPEDCRPSRSVPVIIFHGVEDKYAPYAAVSGAVSFWVKHNGCKPTPETKRWGKIRQELYTGDSGGAEVAVYSVENGGHAWPGGTKARWRRGDAPTQEISASELILDFFLKHIRNAN